MKILSATKRVDFADLGPGDCFRWLGHLFIKANYKQYAVSLADGCTATDLCGEEVMPVNAEIQIID